MTEHLRKRGLGWDDGPRRRLGGAARTPADGPVGSPLFGPVARGPASDALSSLGAAR